jgi:signal transduction histidine kinase
VDINERKRAEEELKAAKQQADLYVDLMGHDINNMNQVSMGFLELAYNIIEMEGKLGEDNIILLDKAMDSLNNSSQLIDNVRKLQREKMGMYKPEVLDVGSVIQAAAKQFHSIPGRDVKIACTMQEHCRVSANGLLKDVFINLIGNAVKHSMDSLMVKIRVDQVIDNGIKYCRVDVEDDGPGIPDSLKNTLFDRLNLTTTRARGKGFGLCLIKMLMDDFHGKFWVEDRIPGALRTVARHPVLDPCVGYLHELAGTKQPLIYDVQELYRWMADLAIIRLLEDHKLKKSDFIVTENYHTRLRETTSSLLVDSIRSIFNIRSTYK